MSLETCVLFKSESDTAINTFHGSTLGDNFILSHHVNYMSSALIPAEAVENDREQLVVIR